MNRKAFLLGFFSIGGQVLLLRELVSSFNGDELFIGTALFGWLLSVAFGAAIGGREKSRIKAGALFLAGAAILPLMIVVARLIPLVVTDVPGEIIPFTWAALLSIVLMIPVGVISGWLFPVLTREEHRPAASIVQVYLFEGIGAFVGGVVIVALVGFIYSTLAMALALGSIVLGLYYLPARGRAQFIRGGTVFLVLLLVWFAVPYLDNYLDRVKYSSFQVEKTFDTHYGRQTILSRKETTTLLTDNSVEATYPDLWVSENLLIPPLLYKPESRDILYIGRSEFGVRQLADSLSETKLTALDPRKQLSSAIDGVIPFDVSILRVNDDQLSFFAESNSVSGYDIIILNPGDPDNYKNSRLFTERFLGMAKTVMKDGGILYFASAYDTDRYIAPEKKALLSVIYNTLRNSFNHVSVWPGEMTLFFASDESLFGISNDSIFASIEYLNYSPQYINEIYLSDRLNDFKVERLKEALSFTTRVSSMDRPVLPYYQAIFRSTASGFDRKLIPFLFERPILVVGIAVLIICFFCLLVTRRRKRRSFGLFLYFTAGIVSLSLELISFYVYQSAAGSLYSELAILIGAFMLGLATGTYYSFRIDKENLEYPALLLLLTAAVIFFATYDRISYSALLYYHIFFLFTAALATGSLFVAATDRYYFGRADSNRGVGYAFELIGSSAGALTATTVLLPLIGLQWLLISIIILTAVALIGAILTA